MFSALSVALMFLTLFLSTHAKKYYNGDLIITPIKDAPAGIYSLGITYYTENQQEARTDTTQYFVIRQCDESHGNLPYVELNVIAPENPTLNTSGDNNYVVLELSNVIDKWDESTIFAVNYIYDIQNPIIFTNIGWKYTDQPKDIYGRFRAYGGSVAITLLVSYRDSLSSNEGIFKKNYIPGSASVAIYEELNQYIKASQIYQVKNNQHVVFNFSVCTRESIDPHKWDKYTLDINVISDLSAPLSAFDLVACAVTEYPNPNDCTFNNIDAEKDQDAAPLVSVQMSNDESTDLSHGVYLTVYGKGGNSNGNNLFLIEVKILRS